MTTGPNNLSMRYTIQLVDSKTREIRRFFEKKQKTLTFDAIFFNLYKFAVQVLSHTVEKKLVGLFVFKGCLNVWLSGNGIMQGGDPGDAIRD